MAKKKGKKVAGNTLKWLLALFMFSGCMVYWFSFASIIFALLGIYFLPIAPIQNFFKNFMPKKKILRGIIAFVIFFFGCLIAPATETTSPETPSTDIVISSEATSEPTVEATIEVTSGFEIPFLRFDKYTVIAAPFLFVSNHIQHQTTQAVCATLPAQRIAAAQTAEGIYTGSHNGSAHHLAPIIHQVNITYC